MKIENDKYYTPSKIAEYCILKTFEIIGIENVEKVIEPSAGNGSFSSLIPCKAYDIEPEHKDIIKADFLGLNIEYVPKTLIIGNPPFGERNNLALQFFKKSCLTGDYISFILPISQLNNSYTMYEFDLLYSEDLGEIMFSESKIIHCCLNVYKRPLNGLNYKPKIIQREDCIVHDYRRGNKVLYNIDCAIIGWGYSSGKILKENQYLSKSQEFHFEIKSTKRRKFIFNKILENDWTKLVVDKRHQKIQLWRVISELNKILDHVEPK